MANPQRHQYKVHKATTCGKHRGRSARPSYIAGSCKLLFALLMDVLNVPKHRTTKIPLAIFFFFFFPHFVYFVRCATADATILLKIAVQARSDITYAGEGVARGGCPNQRSHYCGREGNKWALF